MKLKLKSDMRKTCPLFLNNGAEHQIFSLDLFLTHFHESDVLKKIGARIISDY